MADCALPFAGRSSDDERYSIRLRRRRDVQGWEKDPHMCDLPTHIQYVDITEQYVGTTERLTRRAPRVYSASTRDVRTVQYVPVQYLIYINYF